MSSRVGSHYNRGCDVRTGRVYDELLRRRPHQHVHILHGHGAEQHAVATHQRSSETAAVLELDRHRAHIWHEVLTAVSGRYFALVEFVETELQSDVLRDTEMQSTEVVWRYGPAWPTRQARVSMVRAPMVSLAVSARRPMSTHPRLQAHQLPVAEVQDPQSGRFSQATCIDFANHRCIQLDADAEAMRAHEVVDQSARLVPVHQFPPQRQQQYAERAEWSNAFDRGQAANGPIVSQQQVRLESDGQRHGGIVGTAHASGIIARAVDAFYAYWRQEPMQFIGLGRVERTRQHFFTNLLRYDDIVSQDTVNQGKPPDLPQEYQRTRIGDDGHSGCRSAANSSGP